MGVPSFYRWLVGRYPKIVVNAIDEGEGCAYDDPNPNGEFDNLYLDMNGIIHPCFHPDDELFPPSTFDAVFSAMFDYIDILIRIVRPRKLLYVAVDGVAPRAKMNQQRARRYRAAKDAEIAEIEEERLRREFGREGKELLPNQVYSEVYDSNVITPGTVFMQKLSKALEYYIRLRLNDPFWKSIMVILSDANVPGEGEHKIMSFIRCQRSLPGYNPNTRHCIYGLDADLIMLALATHEIHFCVLREDVYKQDHQEICLSTFVESSSKKDLAVFKSRAWFKKFETVGNRIINKKPYQFLNIWILREYLELDMKPRFDADMERIVDDFIFICFFAGNDFLPHILSIEIHESGIDLLIDAYKKMFKSMGDYIVNASNINKKNAAYINLKGFQIFIMEIASCENRIFEKRYTLTQKKLQRLLQEREKDQNHGASFCNSEFNVMQESFNYRNDVSKDTSDSFSKMYNVSSLADVEDSSLQSNALENTKELKRKLKQLLRDKADLFKNEVLENDKVKLGCPGWKTRYYKEKFSAENTKEVEAIRKDLVKKYVEGLCWVLQYYFTGICSWSWYYPFYYGPFASDFKELGGVEVSFAIGRPFKPFDQLMAVLPPRSSHALPKAYRDLMNDDDSPISIFYPKDFVVDNDGKRFTWQGVCKLPFIKEETLLGATKGLLKKLQPDEIERNCANSDKVFVMDSNYPAQHQVSENYPKEIKNHDAVVARYATSINQEPQSHIPRPLDGVKIPEKTITDADIVERMLWHEYPGHFPPQPLQQRDVQALPELVSGQPKVSGEGWGSLGRGKVPVSSSLVGPGKETWRGVGEVWSGLGRGKLLVDRTLSSSGKETWKDAREGWGSVGQEKLPMDRTLSGSWIKPSHAFPATHFNRKDNEYIAAASVSNLNICDNFQRTDKRSAADRSDNWRRSTPLVSTYGGRGRGRLPWSSHESQVGDGRVGYQNLMWVPRKHGQTGERL